MNDLPRKIRVALADDEPMGRASIRALLGRDPEIELVAECANGMEAITAVRELRPEILFLDVKMPGMDGFDVVDVLSPDELPVIVFATAFDHYAVGAFEVHAVDYLLKPFDDERFATALQRAKDRVRSELDAEQARQLAGVLSTLDQGEASAARPTGELARRLTIHREGRVDVVDTNDLIWIEAADQYVQLHTPDGVFLMRESMGHLQAILDPERFHRIHRSAIVALDQIRALERHSGGGGRVRIGASTWVPVSRSRMAELRTRLG